MGHAVLYATTNGNEKKIGEAIGAALDIPVYDVMKVPKLGDVDTLFIVGKANMNKCMPELTAYLRTLYTKRNASTVKRAVLLGCATSAVNRLLLARLVLMEKGIDVQEEEFCCPGKFFVMNLNRPNAEDIANAVAFAKRSLEAPETPPESLPETEA